MNRNCFGAFDEIAYFVPRVIELLADSENGFELIMNVFGMIQRDRENYAALDLWNIIADTMLDVFYWPDIDICAAPL